MKKDLDWANIGFKYIDTGYRYVCNYKNNKWEEGGIITDNMITMSECACVLQYAQTCFEGLKAYTTVDGRTVCFRPDMNAKRMASTCKYLEMPVFPEEKFVEAIVQTVKANADYVPPYGTGATLYLRPYMFGIDSVIGLKPANEFQFRVFGIPVGTYYKADNNAKGISLQVPDFDRAAPKGTGHIKAGLNYAMSLHAYMDAHNKGFNENLYLDPATRTNIEESGGANVIFVAKDNKIVTPKSNSILPSITKQSLLYIAKHYLGLETEERVIPFAEIKDFKECAICGTAAVMSPVGRIYNNGEEVIYNYKKDMGEITKQLYDTLLGIQLGKIKAPDGWLKNCD